jgi:hypothetical protein
MTGSTRWVAAGLVALAALGLALGRSLAYGGDGAHSGAPTAPTTISAEALLSLYDRAAVGQKEQDVLAAWPPPYEHYRDNLGEDCYEWKGADLYNLCFKARVLHLKTSF